MKNKGSKARPRTEPVWRAGAVGRAGRRIDKEFEALYEYAGLMVRAALAEDIGAGDITTGAIVPKTRAGTCELRAKQGLVLSGLFVSEMAFKALDKKAVFKALLKDGDTVRKGRVVATVTGRLAALLTAERVALNFLQRLSGISTMTNAFVKRVSKTSAKILDTRKTTPCFRSLERYAVRLGGGYNHRSGLDDFVLIKDNHIKAAGGVAEAVARVEKLYHAAVPIEVEASTLKEVRSAVKSGADIVMLDNMSIEVIRRSMELIDNHALVEVSGGVTLENARGIASLGVDFISVGALTHSAPAVDISMGISKN